MIGGGPPLSVTATVTWYVPSSGSVKDGRVDRVLGRVADLRDARRRDRTDHGRAGRVDDRDGRRVVGDRLRHRPRR